MRITNSIIFNTAIENLQNQHQRLFRIQEEATSGKKILRLSDDPVRVHRIFDFRQKLTSMDQFQQNQDHINSFLSATDNALQGVESLLQKSKELALSGLKDSLKAEDRMAIAREIKELIGQAVQLGNTEFAGRFIFAGTTEQSAPPFSDTGQFSGNSQELSLEIAPDHTLPMNILGSQFLTSDLRPNVELSTSVASLQEGQGLSPGAIRITDRAGNSAVIDLSTATTLEDILTTISNAPGLNVTAALNAEGNGIAIIDNHASPTQNLTVEEVGGGTTAKELGIFADRSSDIVGTPLHPAVAPSTPLALLYEGQGVVPSTVRITNGAVEVEVDLSSALTLDDVITTINAAGVNVTASINTESTALDVRSNDASTVAIVTDIGGGTTAADLGIQGGRDVLKTLQYLEEALQRDDLPALDHLLTQLDSGLTQVLSLRSEVGARLHRVQLAQEQNAAQGLAVTSLLSQTQDADAMEVFSRLTQQAFAFEAALASTAEMIQPTLLDFLR